MSRVAHENKVKVFWLTALDDATLAEVTVAEIAAGTELSAQNTADGLSVGGTDNRASIDMMDTGKIAEFPGTYSRTTDLKFARDDDDTDDVAWELFEHGLEGFLVVSDFGAPVAGSRVSIYKGASFDPRKEPSAANTFQQYTVAFGFTDWEEKALVVAS